MSRYRIGADIGGTFTDFVVYDVETGEVSSSKVPTTPDDPARGLLQGLAVLGLASEDVRSLTHGTTIATNLLIERNGAKTAFLTTEGFRDTLEIRRGFREDLYDAQWLPPAPLVPRRHRLEVSERLDWDGTVVKPLDLDQVDDLIETLRVREIESVAVCLLHSYQHPGHERQIRDRLQRALPDVYVSISSDLTQEFREFERGSTVAANALVGPTVQRYMGNVVDGLAAAGMESKLTVIQSNGGVCTAEEAGLAPAKLARSGPVGAAMALKGLADRTGRRHLVSIDIGGTSADVAVVVDGQARRVSPLMVEWGLPLLFSSVDVESIGAGGGSIAWIDDGGALHMGPQSAGADPGPACFGRGGTAPTSTDAHLVLGRLSPDYTLHESVHLDVELSREAIRSAVAEPLGLGVEAAAEGMLRILDDNMLQAIRYVTLEKGYDPREFTLVGCGGGGSLHAPALARELGMAEALIPVFPGVQSAWGLLTVDMFEDRSRTVLKRRKALSNEELTATFDELRASIAEGFARQRIPLADVTYEFQLDMQYYGQAFSMSLRVDDIGADDGAGVAGDAPFAVDDALLDGAVERFHREHLREYGHADRDQEVQIVHARVFGSVAVDRPSLPQLARAESPDPSAARIGEERARFDGEWLATPVYSRPALLHGHRIAGPAMIVEASTRTVLAPGMSAEVDATGNLAIDTGVAR